MFAEKVENINGITLKHCHCIKGPTNKAGFLGLVQGIGF